MIVFDDMIADMPNNKKLGAIVTQIFVFGRKLNNCIVFISQYYFVVPKNVRWNLTHYFIVKTPYKSLFCIKLQIAFNHSSDIRIYDFIKIQKNCNNQSYYFLVNDTTLSPYDLLRFRKYLLQELVLCEIQKVIKTIEKRIKHEKLHYNIDREAAKTLALSSRKISKYECLTDDEILTYNQSKKIKQTN